MPASTVSPAPPVSFTDDDVADGLAAIAETFTRPDSAGVAILDGFGCRLRVDRSHLEASDGLGEHRRVRRWPRADRTLRRVVIFGEGYLTTQSLRFARSTGTAIVVLDDDGVVLAAAPQLADDCRLRLAQAAAASRDSPVGLHIATSLLDQLLAGRARLASTHLDRAAVAHTLDTIRGQMNGVSDVDELRMLEAVAADEWWSSWESITLRFVRRDRVPEAWTKWSGRASVLGGIRSPRHAINPTCALLNLGYRIAEVEALIAVQAAGLDPAFGFSHSSRPNRQAFVLDVQEPLRIVVEELVLDLIHDRPFSRRDFSELATGEVRVLPPVSHEVVEQLMPRLASAAGPVVEGVARVLAESAPGAVRPTTPLTKTARKRAGAATWAARQGRPSEAKAVRQRNAVRRCEGCGAPVGRQRSWCQACWPNERTEAGKRGSARARQRLDDPAAREAKGEVISAARRAGYEARIRAAGFDPADWESQILPALRTRRSSAAEVCAATGLGVASAYSILEGRRIPTAEHWRALVGLSKATSRRGR
jgi:CRISPR-associated protein Cas1